MTIPIPNCPQPETPIRERAWADGQRQAEPKYSDRRQLGRSVMRHTTNMEVAMKNYPRVWKLKDILDHATNTDGAVSVCVRGRWVPARPMGWPSIKSRFKAAWLVFTGKADAVTWPEDDAA